MPHGGAMLTSLVVSPHPFTCVPCRTGFYTGSRCNQFTTEAAFGMCHQDLLAIRHIDLLCRRPFTLSRSCSYVQTAIGSRY